MDGFYSNKSRGRHFCLVKYQYNYFILHLINLYFYSAIRFLFLLIFRRRYERDKEFNKLSNLKRQKCFFIFLFAFHFRSFKFASHTKMTALDDIKVLYIPFQNNLSYTLIKSMTDIYCLPNNLIKYWSTKHLKINFQRW